MSTAPSLDTLMGRIEALTQILDGCKDSLIRSSARELVGAVLELHRSGLTRMLAKIFESEEPTSEIMKALLDDELITNLLLLHELHPMSVDARIEHTLRKLKVRLGASVQTLECVELGTHKVILRMAGNCAGCATSFASHRVEIENAIRAIAPELDIVEFENPAHCAPSLFALPVVSL